MRSITIGMTLICFILPSLASAAGQTRWVSDQTPLDLRSGNSNEYRIIKYLPAGTEVTVLAVDEQTQFSQVMTKEGLKGWLTNGYLMNEPSGREQLAQANATLAKLREGEPLHNQLEKLEQEVAQLRNQLSDEQSERQQAEQELGHIKEVSANAIDLDNSNQALMEANQLLQHELDVLKGENSRLKDSSSSAWFIKGALAVGLGALLALAIPYITPTRKSKEWR